ncbi:MAG: molybdenum cofactor biosynthesis protein MoaB [Proteobacteria bacterium]|nr:molybdenum cofactor biosynthesis protein MoaB [Pseudomonadota bacterium]MBU1397393.1 molybdenum cofactor biosynthesis protein MoaB [Pseudomonadota bacterium]MBU1571475.1 molybdenum cofactor biosynthesis protein MoaB [Pseudomonadota bacterium]
MGSDEHKKNAPKSAKIGVISVSSTRTEATDESGSWIKKRAIKEGHEVVFYQVVSDDVYNITEIVRSAIYEQAPQVLLLTGGTGISSKDVTIEAVRPLFEKELTAFGPIFSQLSFEEIDSAALLSRATAGVIGQTIVFCMPGSLKACKLACKVLIFPELGHLAKHVVEG